MYSVYFAKKENSFMLASL